MTPSASRYFFALWPDNETRERVGQVAGTPALDRARRVDPQCLHLTLQFLGNIDSAVCVRLARAVDGVLIPQFPLYLDTSGWWKSAKVIWLGPSCIPPALQALHDALHTLAGLQRIPMEERPYHPHITLARKANVPVRLQFEPFLWKVTDFCLIESIPHTGYVEYGIIRRWTLT